jgi:hypothetical protein
MAVNPQPDQPRRPKEPDESTEPSPAGERPSEFERFEALTRKLIRVPKSEVDEKRKAS